MTERNCPQYDAWLERLPRTQISPELSDHLEECRECRKKIAAIIDTARSIGTGCCEPELTDHYIDALTRRTLEEGRRLRSRTLYLRLFLVSILSFPVVVLINSFWGFLGFQLLETAFSERIAQTYIIFFALGSIFVSGLTFGSLPILTGIFRSPDRLKEQ